MDTVFLSELCTKIGFDSESASEITSFIEKEKIAICAAVNRCSILPVRTVLTGLSAKSSGLRNLGMMNLAFCVAMCEKAHEWYAEKGIPDEIFYDTMSDIYLSSEEFRADYGFPGISDRGWISNHLSCSLFRLGRLQFQLYRLRFPSYIDRSVGRKAIIKQGKRCINVHIPGGAPLNFEECRASFEAAEKFFAEYFPNFKYTGFVCNSWLLYPGNSELLPEDSNILKFASLWQTVEGGADSSEAIKFIFGRGAGTALASFPENTSLQRAAKASLMDGRHLGMGFGIRPLQNEITGKK